MIIGKWYKVNTDTAVLTLMYVGFDVKAESGDFILRFTNRDGISRSILFSEITGHSETNPPAKPLLDYLQDCEPGEIIIARDEWSGTCIVIKADNNMAYKAYPITDVGNYKVHQEDQE